MLPLMKNAFLKEQETRQALADFILKDGRLSMDAQCFKFEKRFAEYQGRREAVLFNSGASANLAILQSLKNLGRLKQGDKVGFSALTWATNTMPIIQMGMEPVAIDCAPETINVMSSTLRERLKAEKLNALFITNGLGFTGDLDKIRDLCETEKVLLLEDNCESLGTELPAGRAGNFGLASSFSFFVAHHMSTIEGGMACTDDQETAEMLRIVRANGWDRNLNHDAQFRLRKKYGIKSEFEAKYTFYDLGFNMRPTEITGFLGLYQMRFLEENIDKREKNYLFLEETARENPDLVPMDHSHIKRLSSFAFPVLCRTPELRNVYLSQFSGAGIEIRPMISGNIQKQPFYAKYAGRLVPLPGADFVHDCGFYCGNYPELTDADLELIKSALTKY